MVSKKKALWVRQGLKLATTKICGIESISDAMIGANTAKSEVMSRLKSEPPACRRFFSWRRSEGFPMNQERLKELLHYCPETGQFTWLVESGSAHVGARAGVIKSNKYVTIGVNGKRYHAHRLAWFWMTGYWPKQDIDHINRQRADNRWCNLREVSRSKNLHNTDLRKDNSSGFKGIQWDAARNKWHTRIKVEGTNYFLGRFSNLTDAAAARAAAESKYQTQVLANTL
jgi:hypothetical protein